VLALIIFDRRELTGHLGAKELTEVPRWGKSFFKRADFRFHNAELLSSNCLRCYLRKQLYR
jgi:hypothetical protein